MVKIASRASPKIPKRRSKAKKHKAARWQRRKEERPAEILEAALSVFAEKGFAAAKLDEIARKAGVAKGLLYLYFATKEDLFRATVKAKVSPDLGAIKGAADAIEAPFSMIAPMVLSRAAELFDQKRIGAMARMVIGESRNFPDLARIWHADIVAKGLSAISGLIARGQKAGQVREGDPMLHALSLMAPMLMAALYREVFPFTTAPDLKKLARQHADTLVRGLGIRKEE